jgi:hypothetical protein
MFSWCTAIPPPHSLSTSLPCGGGLGLWPLGPPGQVRREIAKQSWGVILTHRILYLMGIQWMVQSQV